MNPQLNGAHSANSNSYNQPQHYQHYSQAPRYYTPASTGGPLGGGPFEIFEWFPAYQSCQRYFLDHAQHDHGVQAVAALANIQLPHQWPTNQVFGYKGSGNPHSHSPDNAGTGPWNVNSNPGATRSAFNQQGGYGQGQAQPQSHFTFAASQLSPPSGNHSNSPSPMQQSQNGPPFVSLIPYIRRLIVTGFDQPPVLQGFFGDEWRKGVAPLQECERRNYLFAAKSGGWAKVKAQYDMGPQETVPFLQPPIDVKVEEIENAEKLWSQWLATEDWMIGPRAPAEGSSGPVSEAGVAADEGVCGVGGHGGSSRRRNGGPVIKREEDDVGNGMMGLL